MDPILTKTTARSWPPDISNEGSSQEARQAQQRSDFQHAAQKFEDAALVLQGPGGPLCLSSLLWLGRVLGADLNFCMFFFLVGREAVGCAFPKASCFAGGIAPFLNTLGCGVALGLRVQLWDHGFVVPTRGCSKLMRWIRAKMKPRVLTFLGRKVRDTHVIPGRTGRRCCRPCIMSDYFSLTCVTNAVRGFV